MMQLLLDSCADIEAEQWQRRSASHIAASEGKERISRFLLNRDANVKARKHAREETALFIALS